ncbi:unnamed protein product [Citrullus colocynthis]|uniref:Uncharacterized protein n=1 Tax=Citrullus colocynthis TaxID=252529 RepID=A0ABP0XWM4_9ROSI
MAKETGELGSVVRAGVTVAAVVSEEEELTATVKNVMEAAKIAIHTGRPVYKEALQSRENRSQEIFDVNREGEPLTVPSTSCCSRGMQQRGRLNNRRSRSFSRSRLAVEGS